MSLVLEEIAPTLHTLCSDQDSLPKLKKDQTLPLPLEEDSLKELQDSGWQGNLFTGAERKEAGLTAALLQNKVS